jgi:hypothetical protein
MRVRQIESISNGANRTEVRIHFPPTYCCKPRIEQRLSWAANDWGKEGREVGQNKLTQLVVICKNAQGTTQKTAKDINRNNKNYLISGARLQLIVGALPLPALSTPAHRGPAWELKVPISALDGIWLMRRYSIYALLPPHYTGRVNTCQALSHNNAWSNHFLRTFAKICSFHEQWQYAIVFHAVRQGMGTRNCDMFLTRNWKGTAIRHSRGAKWLGKICTYKKEA